MIRTWLSGAPLEAFLAAQAGREPFVQAGGAEAAIPLLGWPTIGGLAAAASQYGQVLYHARRYAEAERQFREALRIYDRFAGEDVPLDGD